MDSTTAGSCGLQGAENSLPLDESSAALELDEAMTPATVPRKQVSFAEDLVTALGDAEHVSRPPPKPNYPMSEAKPGSLMKLVGLRATEYNGTSGRLTIYRKKRKRWGVKLPLGEVVGIRPRHF